MNPTQPIPISAPVRDDGLFTQETADGVKRYLATEEAEELFRAFCQSSNISSNVPKNMPMQHEAYMAGLLAGLLENERPSPVREEDGWATAAAEECYDIIGRDQWEFESSKQSIERFAEIIASHGPDPDEVAHLRTRLAEVEREKTTAIDRLSESVESHNAEALRLGERIEKLLLELGGIQSAFSEVFDLERTPITCEDVTALLVDWKKQIDSKAALAVEAARITREHGAIAEKYRTACALVSELSSRLAALEAALPGVVEALDALIILGEQNVPAPYKPLKERFVRDHLRTLLQSNPAQAADGKGKEGVL